MKYEVQSKMKPALNTGFYTQLILLLILLAIIKVMCINNTSVLFLGSLCNG